MKKLILILVALSFVAVSNAHAYWSSDVYGTPTKSENLYKDSDHDGVINMYDRNDRNPNRTY